MQKRAFGVAVRFLLFLLLFAVIAGLFSVWAMHTDRHVSTLPDDPPTPADFTVVIDAGHGGEDGGACSKDGIVEKDLNLDIAMHLRTLLEANGISVVMTRTDDRLLYDRNENFTGRKKHLDLTARARIAAETPNSIFVSIHMNSYPVAKYSGLQVWYSPNHADSARLAHTIQKTVTGALQPENDRAVKPATSSIYLLHRITAPAVLVECGFLSNPEEAARLNTPAYREELAFWLFLSIMEAQTA